jgi:FlaA1/EpsC-like NDP-sugar epimerase
VIQAAALGRDGEALVLDMGRPIRITDVARQVAGQASHPVDIVFTGLRPGEKLHEELFAVGEHDLRPLHPLISHVAVPPLHPDRALALDVSRGHAALVADLAALCDVRPEVPIEVPVEAIEEKLVSGVTGM